MLGQEHQRGCLVGEPGRWAVDVVHVDNGRKKISWYSWEFLVSDLTYCKPYNPILSSTQTYHIMAVRLYFARLSMSHDDLGREDHDTARVRYAVVAAAAVLFLQATSLPTSAPLPAWLAARSRSCAVLGAISGIKLHAPVVCFIFRFSTCLFFCCQRLHCRGPAAWSIPAAQIG